MIDDIIAEVCTELALLSTFASHIEHVEVEALNRDEALLLSGLSLLSTHAQKVKTRDSGELSELSEGFVTQPRQTPFIEKSRNEESRLTEVGTSSPHNWVFEVLEDLEMYSQANGLNSLAKSIEKICEHNRDSLNENAPIGPAFDCNGVENIVAFAPVRHAKMSRGRNP